VGPDAGEAIAASGDEDGTGAAGRREHHVRFGSLADIEMAGQGRPLWPRKRTFRQMWLIKSQS
jgi:hypothetical protein